MKQVFAKGIIMDAKAPQKTWDWLASMLWLAIGKFMFGTNPSWDINKTAYMMQICHMTEAEVNKMLKENPLKRYPGLLEKIRGGIDDFKKAKLKITIEYDYE